MYSEQKAPDEPENEPKLEAEVEVSCPAGPWQLSCGLPTSTVTATPGFTGSATFTAVKVTRRPGAYCW